MKAIGVKIMAATDDALYLQPQLLSKPIQNIQATDTAK